VPEAFEAPAVTVVGDLHLENFGTWRDAEGRLAWGINDFDEASSLPYTNDLVRLAASAALAYRTSKLRAPVDELAAALLEGYVDCLREGGRPVLFAEDNRRLGRRVLSDLVRPGSFWKKRMREGDGPQRTPPAAARAILERTLPPGTTDVSLLPRVAGVGSLGRPRFLAVGRWNGARIAREAKALVGSAAVWARGGGPPGEDAFRQLLVGSRRSRDPFLQASSGWVVRRLAPDTEKIAITSLGRALELTDGPRGRQRPSRHARGGRRDPAGPRRAQEGVAAQGGRHDGRPHPAGSRGLGGEGPLAPLTESSTPGPYAPRM
jgi:hypothetical protein